MELKYGFMDLGFVGILVLWIIQCSHPTRIMQSSQNPPKNKGQKPHFNFI